MYNNGLWNKIGEGGKRKKERKKERKIKEGGKKEEEEEGGRGRRACEGGGEPVKLVLAKTLFPYHGGRGRVRQVVTNKVSHVH